MRLTIESAKEMQAALRDISDDVYQAADAAVMETAANLEAGVKLRMQQGPHTGKLYRRRSVVHRASAPGEAPAPDTGALLGSIYHEREGRLTAVAGSRMAYAAYLEFGTTRMPDRRPAWVPEVEEERPRFLKALEAAIAGAVR